MSCECPTCCCEHAGTFPRFSFYYDDGSVYQGGGPDDTKQKVLSFPQSWFDMPDNGVMVGVSEDPIVGRRLHKGGEMYYAIPPQTHSGSDVNSSGPETRLIPFVSHALGLVKLGQHAPVKRYKEMVALAMQDEHVPPHSANSPFAVKTNRD